VGALVESHRAARRPRQRGEVPIMGFDEIKNKVTDLISDNSDKVSDGVDKATDFIDDKTGGKYSEHLEGVDDKARDFIDGLDGEKGEDTKPA
jgi:hypothetical protein